MRESIFTLMTTNKINVEREFLRLKELIEEDTITSEYNVEVSTLYDYLDYNYFRKWPLRNRAISLDDFFSSMNIRDNHGLKEYTPDCLLLYIEVILNLLHFSKFENTINQDYGNKYDHEEFHLIMDNINSLLESLNYKYIINKKSEVVIMEKDAIATNVAENNFEIADEIIEYRKYSLKGNISEKARILKLLSNSIEAKLIALKGTSYNQIADDVGYLINNYNIRHNNCEGAHKKSYMNDISAKELEEIYDMTYELILAVYTTDNYLNYKVKIDELKKKYTAKY